MANHGWKRPDKRLARTQATAIVARSPERAKEDPVFDARVAAAEREAVLDQILTDLWKGKLTREIAIGRIMAQLGLPHHRTQAEVDGLAPLKTASICSAALSHISVGRARSRLLIRGSRRSSGVLVGCCDRAYRSFRRVRSPSASCSGVRLFDETGSHQTSSNVPSGLMRIDASRSDLIMVAAGTDADHGRFRRKPRGPRSLAGFFFAARAGSVPSHARQLLAKADLRSPTVTPFSCCAVAPPAVASAAISRENGCFLETARAYQLPAITRQARGRKSGLSSRPGTGTVRTAACSWGTFMSASKLFPHPVGRTDGVLHVAATLV
jgi:hypothetical protein